MRMRMTLINGRGSLLINGRIEIIIILCSIMASLSGFMHTVLAKETDRTDQYEQ